MKKTVLIALLISIFNFQFSTSRAQHFDWAKGFGTSNANNGACHITGSVTDSVGNLYILGQFRNDSEWGTGWDAERLLPMTPYGPNVDNINTIIAKISSDGEMVWKKVIHSNNGTNHIPMDIKKVGDTAFACLVEMHVPNEDRYVYWLDTLIPGRSNYPVNSMYVRTSMRTAFIMFDFEGNVLEQHFLYQTYTDTAGNDFVKYYNNDPTPWLSGDRFRSPSFDIDAEGNIYICRASMDWIEDSINAQNGTIRGIKFWVDNRQVGVFINDSRPMMWYPQIMKFAPHFDTLLACRYLVQKCSDNIDYSPYDTRTVVDKNGNVYIRIIQDIGNNNHGNTITVDSIHNIIISHCEVLEELSCIIKCNSNLTPLYAIFVQDSITGSTPPLTLRMLFHDISFDDYSNTLFISGFAQKDAYSTVDYYVGGTRLALEKNDAFVIALNANTGAYKNCTIIPSLQSSNLGIWDSRNNLITQSNRILIQCQYYGGIRFTNNTIQIGNNKAGLCLTIFDYSGNLINGIDYKAIHPRNRPGSILLHDSLLYLCGELISNATFGDVHFSTNSLQYAFIAKYVDPALILPYTGDTGDVNIILTPDVGVYTAYPNPFRQRVNIKIENTELKTVNGRATALLTDITGRSEEVPLTTEGPGRYVLDLSARPQASYYLTLTIADGRQHTVTLLKQSDRFGTE